MDLSMVGFEGLASSDPCFASSDHETKHKLYGSDWRGLKMAKTEDYSSVSYSSNKHLLRSNSGDGQQMLSFSVTDSKNGGLNLYNNASNGYYANTGYGYGAGVRGPFTPSQWMELEHQALIYKYILANVSVPSNLLIPIKKALDSAAFSVGPLRPASYGWAGFHLGFSTNTDPEPGRCRRTDGKKWRCSRDAVADQKYCERHINRGRHRSRKPVEGLSASTTTANNAATATSAKLIQTAAAAVSSPAAVAGSGMSHQLKSNASNASLNMNGIFLNNNSNLSPRNQATTDLSMFSSGINSKNTQFSIEKPQNEFGLVFSSSLLNPIQEPPSSTHHHFIDEWPKDNLSISIPISTSEFTSSTSSPTEEKLASSPLRLSSNWVPLSWEGPLGEALHNTNQISSNEFKLSSGSPKGPFQRMGFGSQTNSSAGSSPRGVATSLTPLL